jgi:hypothetical protein
MATATRARLEREAVLAAVREINRKTRAAGSAASFWTAVLALGAWLGLAGLMFGWPPSPSHFHQADPLARSLTAPALLVWLVSVLGLAGGVLALAQKPGRKGLAVLGVLSNGLLCVAPLAALLLWMK